MEGEKKDFFLHVGDDCVCVLGVVRLTSSSPEDAEAGPG